MTPPRRRFSKDARGRSFRPGFALPLTTSRSSGDWRKDKEHKLQNFVRQPQIDPIQQKEETEQT